MDEAICKSSQSCVAVPGLPASIMACADGGPPAFNCSIWEKHCRLTACPGLPPNHHTLGVSYNTTGHCLQAVCYTSDVAVYPSIGSPSTLDSCRPCEDRGVPARKSWRGGGPSSGSHGNRPTCNQESPPCKHLQRGALLLRREVPLSHDQIQDGSTRRDSHADDEPEATAAVVTYPRGAETCCPWSCFGLTPPTYSTEVAETAR